MAPTLGRFPHGHAVSPSDSQEECVTPRSVLAVSLVSVLPLDYLTPDAAACGAGTGRHGAHVGGVSEPGRKHETTADRCCAAFDSAGGHVCYCGGAGGGGCGCNCGRWRRPGQPSGAGRRCTTVPGRRHQSLVFAAQRPSGRASCGDRHAARGSFGRRATGHPRRGGGSAGRRRVQPRHGRPAAERRVGHRVRANRPGRHQRLPHLAAHPAAGHGRWLAFVDRQRAHTAKRGAAAAGHHRRPAGGRPRRPGRRGRPGVQPVRRQRWLDPRRPHQRGRRLPQPA